jgi:nicotinamidase-related amidase
MKTIRGHAVCETLDELIDPVRAALLVIDVQNDFVHPDGLFAVAGKSLTTSRKALERIARLADAARRLGIALFFIQQTTPLNGRGDTPPFLRFKMRDDKSPDYTLEGSWGWQLAEELKVGPGDCIVRKFRSDAFLWTNLDQLLRASRIETVIATGVITEGCVESTVRSAGYHDYYVVVAEDCVASPNADLHEGSMRLMRSRYVVTDSDTIIAGWQAAGGRSQPAKVVDTA